MSYPTGAQLGIGTKIEFETVVDASPIAFTTLSECLDIPEIPHTREFVEATNQDSEGYTREYIAGLIDAEEFTLQANYVPHDATQDAVWDMQNSLDGGRRLWRIRETTASPEITWTFRAMVASFNPAFPVAEKKVLSITLRRTGPTTKA